MKLLGNNPTNTLPDGRRAQIVIETTNAIGTKEQMLAYYARPLSSYMGEAGASLSRMLVTYGQEPVKQVIRLHFAAALVRLGETKADYDLVTSVSEAIADSVATDARLLDFNRLLGFFRALVRGDYDLYGLTHLQVMRAFRDYCRNAYHEQVQARRAEEKQQQEKEDAEHQAKCVTWEKYKQMRGIKGDNPLNAF